jgi:hypothetical protein
MDLGRPWLFSLKCLDKITSQQNNREVDSRQTNFLFLYGLIVTFIVISFLLIRRSPRAPVKLDLRAEPPPPPNSNVSSSSKAATPGRSTQTTAQLTGKQSVEDDTAPGRAPDQAPAIRRPEKPLNVLFNWNGYTWDAYEVLGIPAGSSREAVRLAFQRAQTQSTSEALPFLQAAADAIESQFR